MTEETPLSSELVNAMAKGSRGETQEELYWNASRVDALLPRATVIAVIAWVSMNAGVYFLVPDQHWQTLRAEESSAALVAAVAMFITMLSMIFPLILQGRRPSGIVIAGCTVCSLAMVTNLVMSLMPVPVMVDPVTKARVFLLRWCEWTPLGGLMTFLSESVNMNEEVGGLKGAIFSSALQTLSIFCGFLLPMCTIAHMWWCVFTFSFLPYLYIFPRVLIKRKSYLRRCELKSEDIVSAMEYEFGEQIKFAYWLIMACAMVWSVLVILFIVNMCIHMNLPDTPNQWYHHPSLAMIVDTSFDVLAKAIYLKLITDVHFAAFDENLQVQRRLFELRKLMHVMWNSSSDSIVITVKTGDVIRAVFSPSFSCVFLGVTDPFSSGSSSRAALMLTLSPQETVCQTVHFDGQYFDNSRQNILETMDLESSIVKAAKKIAKGCWEAPTKDNRTALLIEEQVQALDGETRQCEIKVSQHAGYARVGVIRDISERLRLIEAERAVHMETVARQQDAQAVNRFTRHEVKNGLLEGIELCDHLRSAVEDLLAGVSSIGVGNSNPDVNDQSEHDFSSSHKEFNARRYVQDLDQTLHEILATVLAEVMAREVIHGVYEPRLERIDVNGALTNPGLGVGVTERFPILQPNGPVPYINMDIQLLRHIHRNAVSNACKYGKEMGKVVTSIAYDKKNQRLTIQVINEPGQDHQKLVDMGEAAGSAVFVQGARLHRDVEAKKKHLSAGDGAWIMQQCARTMGGSCSIEFTADKTVFEFFCTAHALVVQDWADTEHFEVPEGTWGIAIDDSNIQRKLLGRIMGFAGIDKSRVSVLGKCLDDVEAFDKLIHSTLGKHPNDRILIIVDENLDFTDEDGSQKIVSGSELMQGILQSLDETSEERLLALVRSANDSSDETAVYCRRTHGYFPKGPMQKKRVREVLAPIWADRFLS